MIKTKLTRITIFVGLWSFLLMIIWVGLFFLIKQDKNTVAMAIQNNQQIVSNQTDLLRLNKDKVATINNYFISNQDTIKLLEDLEKLGQKAGIKLTMGQAGELPTELKLNLATDGAFSGTMKFLQGLENLTYAARVDRLDLRKTGDSWQAVFILRILKNNNV